MNIRFENVNKRFGRTTALDRLTLEAEAGELMVLLGPSGCGKSTSLRLVAGLEAVSEGDIYIGERRVNNVPAQDRDVAMVFQNYALYPHMTVAQNIGYPLLVRKKAKEEIAREVRRVAEQLEIDALLERRPRQLSGGQQQRVALARAIIRHPVAFLMDEPLSNLDANLRLQMRGELKRLQRELGTTMLYVTHDHTEAMTLAHRIALLREGKLQQVGTPMELYRHPANQFVAGFLSTPAMNFLSGAVQGSAFRFSGGAIPLAAEQVKAAAGVEAVVLGFRAQAASLTAPLQPGTFRGNVYVTEEMGSESFVVLTCGECKITVGAGADSRAAIGESLGVVVPASGVHLFDAATGKTVISGTGRPVASA
ncbi:MAG TPA: ABC transporter ATP-binding protein [Candidatus Acidoferrales bacterium]|nr:ABC transporter ATP-binding protein [Candidatus Acidoferrales bacterium]